MHLDENLRQILPRWDRDREDLWNMMGPREKGVMERRIRNLPIRSIEIRSRTETYKLSLDGATKPQATLSYETFYLFMWIFLEEMLQLELNRKDLMTAIGELQGKKANEIPRRAKPKDIARFLAMYVEMCHAWGFFRSATGHWRHGAHKFYNPDTLGKPNEGPKGERDRRHLPLRDVVKGKRILDMGCGFGRIEEDLVAWEAGSVVALDISLHFLRMMEEYSERQGFSLQNIHRVAADNRRLPFRKGSFDMIVAIGTIYQTPHSERIIDEVGGILDEGQRAFLEFEARNPKDSLPPRYSFSLNQYLSEKEARAMLASAGLSIKEIFRIQDADKTDHFYSPLVERISA